VEATLGTLPREVQREGLEAPAVIVIGEVVRFRDRIDWFEPALSALATVL
jgi:siroheme synthase